MLIITGVSALSDFRKKALLEALQAAEPSIQDVSAEYLHFVDGEKLTRQEHTQLEKLLTYDSPFTGEESQNVFIVTPRIGTISSWSTKATDIVHNAGLKKINRVERGIAYYIQSTRKIRLEFIADIIHDKMTENVLVDIGLAEKLFSNAKPPTYNELDLDDLEELNISMGLSLNDKEIEYLRREYKALGRNPSDAELMMFSVVNSEHCRHKIFNASWTVDGKLQDKSLFGMIRNTYQKGGQHVLSAYSDNSAVLRGSVAENFNPNAAGVYSYEAENMHIVAKVETHNHPTAISPDPGAATGIGGEIRDEGATGRGARSKMGLSGFSVSHLRLHAYPRPWEANYALPNHISSSLDIMLEAPIGGSSFSNEFGRPNLAGYFRSFELSDNNVRWGYHKPIMLAGGLGNIREDQVEKVPLKENSLLVVLGGPAMLIGLGGGSASSMQTGQNTANLDFASVQRANAEMQRRAQEVINHCWRMGKNNPIESIHDVGAGGLSNALPELVHDSGLGAHIQLRAIPNAEPSMAPHEIWSNEAQERYVLGINEKDLVLFEELCSRERAEFAIVGHATKEEELVVHDELFDNEPVHIPMSLLFGEASQMERSYTTESESHTPFDTRRINLENAVERVLSHPAVGSKKFLITIGDRTVGGLTARDQMVGPWQVPVSDVAVTSSSFGSKSGEAMAIGERPPVALISPAASVRMAIGELLTNIVAAPIDDISEVAISANWMAAAGKMHEDQHLREAVTAVGEEFCPALGVTVPVGKDSLSMRVIWDDKDKEQSVTSPISMIASGFAPVRNVTKVLTPQLKKEDSKLIYIDLGANEYRLGGSILAQTYAQLGDEAPDADADTLKAFFKEIQALNMEGQLLAYHDRSDGGIFTTIAEMCFAGRVGANIDIGSIDADATSILFSEELGAVIQVRTDHAHKVLDRLKHMLGVPCYLLGDIRISDETINISQNGTSLYNAPRAELEQIWARTSFEIQKLRDNPACAESEYKLIQADDSGISPRVTFAVQRTNTTEKPRAAILREQGVNGQVEMAAAFDMAGFESVDVHMTDLISGRKKLDDFSLLVACGGFSYGDVLGAGAGWGKSILGNQSLREQFTQFFERPDTLALGVCNGCQMMSSIKEIIPGAENWPALKRNESERFEARLVSTEIKKSNSILLSGMEGSILPVPVAHGEGRMVFDGDAENVSLVYVDNEGKPTEQYPLNPNGSSNGVTGVTTPDGRVTIMMPHPERAFLTQQYSWHPDDWDDELGPWFKMFANAREWLDNQDKL